jgi:hypothetical protein
LALVSRKTNKEKASETIVPLDRHRRRDARDLAVGTGAVSTGTAGAAGTPDGP